MAIFYMKKQDVKVKKCVCFILAVAVLINALILGGLYEAEKTYASENLNMYARSYALADGNTGRVLIGKNETNPMANASTTKILTCILTLENKDINEMVSISKNAASQPKVRLGMKEGEQYPLKDLLYALMLESYNDCAVAIAEHVAGSEENFAVLLNEKAKEIGCKDTLFLTPNGLDKELDGVFHHSTAEDLCLIMSYCVWKSPMKDLFLQITQTREYTGTANGKTYSLTNRNAFLDQMSGVLSGKTGFTAKAGYCYVAALEENGERYCIALLACGWPNNKNYKWHDAKILFSYGLDNYDIKEIYVDRKKYLLSIDGYLSEPKFWDLNQMSSLELYVKDVKYYLLMKEGESINQKVSLEEKLELPIEEGAVLGRCDIYLGEVLIGQIPISATQNADEWKLDDVLRVILIHFFTFSS